MSNLFQNPTALAYAFLVGVVPALLWLWFWLKEDKEDPEPRGLLAICFILGMATVIFVLPIEKFIQSHVPDTQIQIFGWAAAEELIKFMAVVLLLYKSDYLHKPINWPIYLITCALGFAAFENVLFLVKPLSTLDQTTVGLLTGNLRYLGSTLLHAVASGMIGISIGLGFHLSGFTKRFYAFIGIISAIVLHTLFNFYIMRNNGSDFLQVFAFLWVATIINLLLFEKLRRMSIPKNTYPVRNSTNGEILIVNN